MKYLDIVLKTLLIIQFTLNVYPLVAYLLFCIVQQSHQTIISNQFQKQAGSTAFVKQMTQHIKTKTSFSTIYPLLQQKAAEDDNLRDHIMAATHFLYIQKEDTLPSLHAWYEGEQAPTFNTPSTASQKTSTKETLLFIGFAEVLLFKISRLNVENHKQYALQLQFGSQFRFKIMSSIQTLTLLFLCILSSIFFPSTQIFVTAFMLTFLAVSTLTPKKQNTKKPHTLAISFFMGHNPLTPRSSLYRSAFSIELIDDLWEKLTGKKQLFSPIKYNIGTVFFNALINAGFFYLLFITNITPVNIISLFHPWALWGMLGLTAIDRCYFLLQRTFGPPLYHFSKYNPLTYLADTPNANYGYCGTSFNIKNGPGFYFPKIINGLLHPVHASFYHIMA